jgi:predicted RNase H-like nuclease (RuvC/YqgF family)
MTENRDKLLLDLEVRLRQVLLLCDKLKQENNHLKDELVLKDSKIDSIKEELSQMSQKYDNLKMARTITAATVDVDTAKLKLSKLVREVDKCIGLLKK